MSVLLALSLAGGLGAAVRFLLDEAIRSRLSSTFPWATFVINLTGSFALGILLSTTHLDPLWVRILGTGLLGGYTTLSTASVDVVRLLLARRPGQAAVYGLGGLAIIVLAAIAGILLGQAL
ncbi:camphor resistance protein CrcB [Brevibacterium sanguinis]|uniref:Fluoride-specific ion channel FluC n=2 Tax=Brevibacterium TaxID=1696 RepID=A0A366IL55_9MICO|nr:MULTISPECIES: CrcB family protein [Brevibacterium]RBP64220.1 camphor resistance protein CrcB [Brevibacterium sanguinis]RBP71488.1 camphor resistance protein CrcB [Brevibacterium celere]